MNKTTFKSKVRSILKDNADDRFVSRLRTGKLDTKAYKNAETTGKVFKKKTERKGKKYAISILIDASGSMNGHEANIVSQAVPKILRPLEELGVEVEINAFNYWFHSYKMFGEKMDDADVERFQRSYRSLCHAEDDILVYDKGSKRMFKYIGKPNYNELEKEYGGGTWFTTSSAGGNCDGWALRQAIERLKKQPGQKIMLVLSDGHPAEPSGYPDNDEGKAYREYEITDEVRRAKKDGITMMSVGINSYAVNKYYPKKNTMVISNVSQVYKTMAKLLATNIKRI